MEWCSYISRDLYYIASIIDDTRSSMRFTLCIEADIKGLKSFRYHSMCSPFNSVIVYLYIYIYVYIVHIYIYRRIIVCLYRQIHAHLYMYVNIQANQIIQTRLYSTEMKIHCC